MFTKLSHMSFIYELVETFCFPNEKTKKIYFGHGIEKILPYHILTDTDSTSIMFQIICEFECNVPDDKFRDVIFLLEKFNARKPEPEKRLR